MSNVQTPILFTAAKFSEFHHVQKISAWHSEVYRGLAFTALVVRVRVCCVKWHLIHTSSCDSDSILSCCHTPDYVMREPDAATATAESVAAASW